MARILVFLATIAAALAGVAALNWWIDPFGEQYHGRYLTQALEQSPPCLISWGVLRPRAWGEYKLDLARRTHLRVLAVGNSRVAKISAWPDERGFANLGAPGLGAQALSDLFEQVHDAHPGKLTVYIDADIFWFGAGWHTATWFNRSYLRDLKYLIAPSTTSATIRLLRRAPGAIRHPQAVLATDIVRQGPYCVVDRGNSVFGGGSAAWAPDGSLFFASELHGKKVPAAPLIDVLRPSVVGAGLSDSAVSSLEDALERARSYGWTVVGFGPPFSPKLERRLATEAQTALVYREYRSRLPRIFALYGYRFLDFTDVASVPCRPDDFNPADGGHPDGACSRKIRAKLDAAAGINPRSAQPSPAS